MKNATRIAPLLALSLIFNTPAGAKRGQVVIYVQDAKDRPVARLQIGVEGAGNASSTDDHGVAILAVGRDTNVGDWIPLVILHSPPGRDLEIVSPWDRRAEVPPFDEKPDNRIKVVVIQHGDRLILANDRVVRAIAENVLKKAGPTSPTLDNPLPNPEANILNDVAVTYGLPSRQIDLAIRGLKENPHDLYSRGIKALYERKFQSASNDLGDSLETFQKGLLGEESKIASDRKRAADAAFFWGQALFGQGKYRDSAVAYQRCRSIFGWDEPALMNNWGMSLIAAGDDASAQPIIERALVAHASVASENPSAIAATFLNFGILLENRGRYADAVKAMEMGTHLAAVAFGPEDPRMSHPYDLLATSYEDVGRISEAEMLYRKAAELDKKSSIAEPDHVANNMANLARLLKRRGDLDDAEPLYRQAIQIDEKAFGPNFPSEGIYLANLAGLLIQKKDYLGAQAALDRSTHIFETTLGLEHPKATVLFYQKGNLAESRGKPDEALVNYRRALQILMKTKGPDDPDTSALQGDVDRLMKQQSQPK